MPKKLKYILISVLAVALLFCVGKVSGLDEKILSAAGGQAGTTASETAGGSSTAGTTAGSENTKGPKFPKGSSVNGVDVSGMTAVQAKKAMDDWAAAYTLELTVNGTTQTYQAADFGVAFAKTDFDALLKQASDDKTKRTITIGDPVTCDSGKLETVIGNFPGANVPAKDASLSYDSTSGAFVLNAEKKGSRIEFGSVRDAVRAAILSRQPSVSVTAKVIELQPAVYSDSAEAQAALAAANAKLAVQLTYTYAPDGVAPATENVGRSQIAGWLDIGSDGLTVTLSSGKLDNYCNTMSKAHSVPGSYAAFQATGGYTIGVSVPTGGQYVNTDALYQDLTSCINGGVSGARTASYSGSGSSSLSFGGNYVEVNLTAQHVWVYRDGQCVVSTDIVSGCVNTGHSTPTGVYTIYQKDTDSTLEGPDYVSYVNYWMAFNGGVGLHDATWRSSFGGSIYEYSGSHGCVNMPYSAAASTYANVSVGTYVIVYGGTGSVQPVPQTVSGTSAYSVHICDSAFKLDAKPEYDTTLTYSSGDSSVATVSADGTVTPVGIGTTTITVNAAEKTGYTAGTMQVTVTVSDHAWDNGVVTTAPTTTSEGVMTYTCSVCGRTKTVPIPALPSEETTSAPTTESTGTTGADTGGTTH